MDKRDRNYVFYEYTQSLCSECLKLIPSKIIIRDKKVYLLKNCLDHGEQEELFEEDVEYFLRKREYDKPGTASVTQTEYNKGCPFDCGLCPGHDQHTCIGLIEITNNCDQSCNVCFANAGSDHYLTLDRIEKMMDFYQNTEDNRAEILQISGGEPTLHPDIIRIIQMAKEKKFKYVMLNTNGLRIAEDESFADELRQFVGGFEIYLQFDGFSKDTHIKLRGKDLREIKEKAILNLTKNKIPVTLVTTLEKGINDGEIGEIINFGINTKYIRGINFQPVTYFGRVAHEVVKDRITLSGVVKRIEEQTNGMLRKSDLIPLPCNVERNSVTYMYKTKDGFIPISRNAEIKKYLHLINNTFAFSIEDTLKETGKAFLSPGNFCCCLDFLNDFKKFVPLNFHLKSKKERMEYIDENTFRISISSFIDKYNFDMKSMQKECVHIITEDFRKIPFSSYNMIYRGV